MIWLQPWAWIGAAAIAVPVLVHLLARRQATVEAFPTLRFLRTAQSAAVRRHRLSEWLLLAVRIAIVAVAAAALAQPFFSTRARSTSARATIARAIVVDASPSMSRRTADGRAGVDVARDRARQIAGDAAVSTTGEAVDIHAAMSAAIEWLRGQPGLRELVVVSDFAFGVVDAADIGRVPSGIGIRLEPIAVIAAPAPVVAPPTTTPAIAAIAGADEQAGVDAARDAALSLHPPAAREDRPIAIVFPRAAERDAVAAQVARLDQPWMADAIVRLSRDATLLEAARAVTRPAALPASLSADRSTIVVAAADGKPLLVAGARDAAGVRQLTLFSMAEAASVFSAALFSRAPAAVSSDTLGEDETRTISIDDLKRWQRAPTDVAPPVNGSSGESDARWFWVAALALLGIETWLRRDRVRRAQPAEVVHARVA